MPQGAGLAFLPGDPAFLLQVPQPALDRCRRPQPHGLHHLADRGAVAVLVDVEVEPVVELLLGAGEGLGAGAGGRGEHKQYE